MSGGDLALAPAATLGISRRGVLAGAASLTAAVTLATPALARSYGKAAALLLIDDGIVLPQRLAAYVEHRRRTSPVAALNLDAAGYNAVRQAMADHREIVGISSGATLFCVERIAWDNGLRLARRSQHSCGALGGTEGVRQLAARFDRTCRLDSDNPAPLQPTSDDDTLHIWTLVRTGATAVTA